MLQNVCLFILAFNFQNLIAADEKDLFLDAKKLCIEQQWPQAIDMFEELLEKYPASRYTDDAKFWIAFCLEKMPDKQQEAFFAFSDLIARFSDSPWQDDALSHQINLATQFVKNGQEQYREFLVNQLNSDNEEIRYRAALALGKLGDERAVPTLKQITGHIDYGPMAANLMAILQSKPVVSGADTVRRDIEMLYDRSTDMRSAIRKEGTAPERDDFLWFGSQRYDQYRSMLRKDNQWSEQELNRFALWHILDSDQFDEFNNLTDDYDRKEWLRKFWKAQDPTPTTEPNEKLIEFERRVKHARGNYAKPWDNRHFRYLPDQYIRTGWYCAPWDARGELYIKFGEPDVRSVHAWHTEEWIYYNYGVDFLVKQYMTNIYGNAINAGSLTRGLHSNSNFPFDYNYNYIYPMLDNDTREYLDWNTYNTYLDANFVYHNQMRYEHQYDAEPISGFEMEVLSTESILTISYRLPAEEFELKSADNTYSLAYYERYSVLDEDMRQVAFEEQVREVNNLEDEESPVEREINCNLPPGLYHIAVYIKDQNSKKLGIFKQTIDTRE